MPPVRPPPSTPSRNNRAVAQSTSPYLTRSATKKRAQTARAIGQPAPLKASKKPDGNTNKAAYAAKLAARRAKDRARKKLRKAKEAEAWRQAMKDSKRKQEAIRAAKRGTRKAPVEVETTDEETGSEEGGYAVENVGGMSSDEEVEEEDEKGSLESGDDDEDTDSELETDYEHGMLEDREIAKRFGHGVSENRGIPGSEEDVGDQEVLEVWNVADDDDDGGNDDDANGSTQWSSRESTPNSVISNPFLEKRTFMSNMTRILAAAEYPQGQLPILRENLRSRKEIRRDLRERVPEYRYGGAGEAVRRERLGRGDCHPEDLIDLIPQWLLVESTTAYAHVTCQEQPSGRFFDPPTDFASRRKRFCEAFQLPDQFIAAWSAFITCMFTCAKTYVEADRITATSNAYIQHILVQNRLWKWKTVMDEHFCLHVRRIESGPFDPVTWLPKEGEGKFPSTGRWSNC
ncbi:hypothetical protein IAU60_002078 [Kwoniella sp. DSM 27419]